MRPTAARIGYDPWLHTSDWVKKATRGAGREGRRAGRGRHATRSTRSGPTGPSRRKARLVVQPDDYAGKSSAAKRAGDGRLADGAEGRRGGARPRSIRSPGRSTSAAQDVDAHAGRAGLSPWSMPTAPPICSSRPRRSATTSASISATASALHERDDVRAARSRALDGKTRRRRSRARGRGDLRGAREGRRQDRARTARSRGPAQGDQEPGRDRRPPAPRRRATARRSRRFLHWLSVEAPKGERRRADGGGRSCRPSARRPASSATCRFDTISGAGPERRDRPLRVERGDQPPARDWTRSTWSIRAANIRTAPPTSPAPSRSATPTDGDARPLHPRAQGPYRARTARLPRRARAAASSTASPASICGQAGLDYAHGTGHGVGSFLAVHEGPQRISPGRQRAARRRRAAAGRA